MTRLLSVITFAILAICAFVDAEEQHASFHGMQGLRLFCDTQEKVDFVRQYEGVFGFDILKLTRSFDEPVEILVAADKLQQFKHGLIANDISYEVAVDDVSKIMEEESALQRFARSNRARSDFFPYYPRYREINDYLFTLENYNRETVKVINIGKSSEGRDILGVRLSNGRNKPALFIDAGIHAREWIAPTTALYTIHQIVNNASNRHILDNIDVYVIPSLNPDGYEYTHTTNRMWRKTRSNTNSNCVGVDANRNFGLKWMEIGASSNPCSDTYAGPKPFSEPETAALRDYMLTLKNRTKVYLTLHSHGQYLLHPWGFTYDLPENEPTLKCVAVKAASSLYKLRSTSYTIGSSTRVLYPAAGGSDDWAMGIAGADLAYTVELPGGRWGFAPPASEIVPVGQETFEAIKVFAQYTAGEFKC